MGYPVELNLEGKKCLVVGGGSTASRKVTGLLQASANVTVVSPELDEQLRRLFLDKSITWIEQPFHPSQLEGMYLVVAAALKREINLEVAREAHARGILVSAVGFRNQSDFWQPAVLRRGDLCIAVSSGGKSAVLANRVRMEIERRFGPEYGDLLTLLSNIRSQALPMQLDARTQIDLQNILYDDAEIRDLLRQKRMAEAVARARSILKKLGH